MIATILGMCPIMRLDDKGKIITYGKVRGKANTIKKQWILWKSTHRAERILPKNAGFVILCVLKMRKRQSKH